MKYQLGDRVLVLHSNEEGEIIDFINDKMVMVEIRGVKFPVYLDQIDFPYFKRFSEKKIVPPTKQKTFIDDVKKEKRVQTPRVIDGVWLTFLPVFETDEFGDEVVEHLKIHLVNRTESAYQFTYVLNFFKQKDFELKNSIEPFQDFYLNNVKFEDVNDSPTFDFDFSLSIPNKKKASHFEAGIRLKPKQLFGRIEKLKEKNEASFSERLFEFYPDKTQEEEPTGLDLSKLASKGYKLYNAKEARQYLEPARSVIDLHIDKLTDRWEDMSNFEMLTLQLETFEKYYDLAIAHRQASLVVIHGVGKGKLREEIHERLKLKREVKSFVNQYHPKFGDGATEIWFQY